ncbi:hypothetical protein D9758_001918 [Tetrapyrgos nigripes]|uniref:C2H2-type domain-containing protein n=1 Tax=Tetrapyrgos nigripes TaxID=182062 RepID=A0A8H5GTM8_9AGAR|nr:hypothetical protein D9758_001918 [Tetrapyrgos nigripes]
MVHRVAVHWAVQRLAKHPFVPNAISDMNDQHFPQALAAIPTDGPATEPNGPRTYTYQLPPPPFPIQQAPDVPLEATAASPSATSDTIMGGPGANHYPSSSSAVPRLPPILQVEKQQVTTSATQLASASRRRNEANFACPVPGCGSTFTRRFNLRGHLRSHTEERPYVCEWPGCGKGFARQHDCKRHQALHTAKPQSNVCKGCKKTFSRLDALNRHLRSDGGAECRAKHEAGLQRVKQEENQPGPTTLNANAIASTSAS